MIARFHLLSSTSSRCRRRGVVMQALSQAHDLVGGVPQPPVEFNHPKVARPYLQVYFRAASGGSAPGPPPPFLECLCRDDAFPHVRPPFLCQAAISMLCRACSSGIFSRVDPESRRYTRKRRFRQAPGATGGARHDRGRSAPGTGNRDPLGEPACLVDDRPRPCHDRPVAPVTQPTFVSGFTGSRHGEDRD